MSLAQTSSRPRYAQLGIGYPVGTAGAETYVGGFQVRSRLESSTPADGVNNGLGGVENPIQVELWNQGDAAFTAAIHQSNDNGDTDAFAAINVRHKGASVASVTVPPGAKVQISVESLTKPYLKLNVPASSNPYGRATFTYPIGELIPLNRAD